MSADRVLDEFAARQYGVFSLEQAKRSGFSSRMIHTRVSGKAWVRMAPSVYALASAPPKWERQMAAALLSRSDALAAGRSAAHLHDFEGFGPSRPVIMIGEGGNARSPLARVVRSRRFDEVGRARRRGFPVTDEAETILTLARDLDSHRLESLVDWVLARKTCDPFDLARVIEASSGAPGVGKLRDIVAPRLPGAYQPPTSELERHLYRVLDHALVPTVTRQLPIRFLRVEATVDAYIPAWRLIVEGDGRRWHSRRADHDRDRLRDNEATAHGYAVLRFSYEMLRDDASGCLDTLLRTGRIRAAS
jgi:very-short-patch-repair endonuclease